MDIDFKRNIIALMQLKGVGRQKIKSLVQMINQPQGLSFPEMVEFGQTLRLISAEINEDALNAALDHADKVLKSGEEHQIKCVSYLDKSFPSSLNFIDAPVLLFYQGNLELLNHPKRAAVIGSRTPTKNGAEFSFDAGRLLAEEDFIVISGLAAGCDYYGHTGCLSAGGRTVAFLPSGLANVYPSENKPLAEKILKNDGCLVSEYTHWETIQPYKFIERDRLQSGSSLFIVVSSFSPGSGTIHTLGYGKKYHKEIFSIPVIFQESQNGFNELSKKKINFTIQEINELRSLIANY